MFLAVKPIRVVRGKWIVARQQDAEGFAVFLGGKRVTKVYESRIAATGAIGAFKRNLRKG